MLVDSGIEAENYEKAKKIIMQQLEEIKNGNISDFEYDASIKTLENSLRSMADEPVRMADFYLGQAILDINDDIETIIQKIKKVSREDIQKVSQKVMLDTVYFMKPKSVGN
jgi:predicted Zn-dependent peptidase